MSIRIFYCPKTKDIKIDRPYTDASDMGDIEKIVGSDFKVIDESKFMRGMLSLEVANRDNLSNRDYCEKLMDGAQMLIDAGYSVEK